MSQTASAQESLPEPELVERVIHGQRVKVKVYPPTSDARWSAWIREKIRAPLEAFGKGEHALD